MVNTIDETLGALEGKIIGILGLTFKPNTSDVRDSPAIDIVQVLLNKGAKIKAYDPEGMDEFKRVVELNGFRSLDLKKLKKALAGPIILYLRNIHEPE
jgi:UDPglucose 6-dehydrogenase